MFTGRSGRTARERLRLLLVADKAGCSPEMIRMLKDDMVHVISRYMDIEKDSVQIRMDTDTACAGSAQGLPVIHANIPVRAICSKGLY